MIQGAIHQERSGPVAMQRARGHAFLSVALSRGASRMVDLAQSGSARIMLPHLPGPRPEAVFLNTSGGLTSGDVLDFGMSVADGARLTATTQTAERAYRALRHARRDAKGTRYCDACFTGDYPTALTDRDSETDGGQLSLLAV